MKFQLRKWKLSNKPESTPTLAAPQPRGACYACGLERPVSEFRYSEKATQEPQPKRWWKLGRAKTSQPNLRYRCLRPPKECALGIGRIVLTSVDAGSASSRNDTVVQNPTPLKKPEEYRATVGLETAERLRRSPPQTPSSHTDTVCCVAFSADGTKALSGAVESAICEWDPSTCQFVSRRQFPSGSTITDSAISPDARHIAWAMFGNRVELWSLSDPDSTNPVNSYRADSWISSITFSADGQYLAVGSGDHVARVLDTASNQFKLELGGHGAFVSSMAFAPDGQRLVTGSGDMAIRLWDLNDGGLLQTFTTSDSYAHALAFSPDNDRFASGSGNKVILWSSESPKAIRKLSRHKLPVEAVNFSPSGSYLASGSADFSVSIWNVDTGHCLQELKGHAGGIKSVAFSPDDSRLASGSADGAVRIWALKLDGHFQVQEGTEEKGMVVHTRASEAKICYRCLGYRSAGLDSRERCMCG